MQDIRKPYTRSRSNRNLYTRVEQFESGKYNNEDAYSDEPVHIPIKGQHATREQSVVNREFRNRRNIHDMDMFPRASQQGEYEDDFDQDDGDIVYKDPRTRYKKSSKGSLGTWIFILVVVLLVVFAGLFTYVLNKATVTVTPKFQDLDTRKTLIFTQDQNSTSIPYILASSSISSSKALQLSESKKVETKASGKIVIYNNFDSQPQRLIKNTRFETAAGKIFRISDSVTVPGKSGDKPGTVEVTVYADSYGADYNSGPTDFTIPGFKGTPRYTGFFARSDGAITGGASGNVSLASLADINAAKDELAIELGQKVKEKLMQVKQDGYIGLYTAIDVEYSDNEQELLSGNTSTYQVTATGYLMLADELRLTQALAQDIRDYKNEPVKLGYGDSLTYSIKDTTNLATATSVDVLIEGNPRVIWTTNKEDIQRLFAGKSRSDFKTIMSGISSVQGGEISFSPLWLSSFPTDLNKIKIVEKLPAR